MSLGVKLTFFPKQQIMHTEQLNEDGKVVQQNCLCKMTYFKEFILLIASLW